MANWSKELTNGALAIVILAMVVGAGLLALTGFQGSLTADTSAYNTTGSFITGLGEFANWPTTIIVIVIVGVILALVMAFAKKAKQ